VDGSTALLIHLADLASTVETDAAVLHAPLGALVGDLGVAIPSYRGLQLTIVESGQPVTLTDLSPKPDEAPATMLTSLRVPLSLMGPEYASDSRVIFYAGTPGALVDLAADLAYVLETSMTTFEPEDGLLVLDADLPPSTDISGLTGLSELSAVSRAVGILIDGGDIPDDAYDTLRRGAADAGVETHVYAARLLGR
jgi:hypothetical protein